MKDSSVQVLVVDDEWTIRQQLSRALGSFGIRCECAVNGDDALDRFVQRRHALVVTDLRMPARNGHSLAVSLLDRHDPPVVVALTGVNEPRLAKDLMARGVAEVVFKPVNYFDLADRLIHILDSAARARPPEAPESKLKAAAASVTLARGGTIARPTRWILEQYFIEWLPRHDWAVKALEWFDWQKVPEPSADIRDAMRQLARRPPRALSDRRCEERVTVNETAVALTLDSALEPVGQPFKLMIRDLSQHGIGLIHAQRLAHEPIAVSWRSMRGPRVVVVARVLRCRLAGACFDIGATIDAAAVHGAR